MKDLYIVKGKTRTQCHKIVVNGVMKMKSGTTTTVINFCVVVIKQEMSFSRVISRGKTTEKKVK